jgi:hypothetical protein
MFKVILLAILSFDAVAMTYIFPNEEKRENYVTIDPLGLQVKPSIPTPTELAKREKPQVDAVEEDDDFEEFPAKAKVVKRKIISKKNKSKKIELSAKEINRKIQLDMDLTDVDDAQEDAEMKAIDSIVNSQRKALNGMYIEEKKTAIGPDFKMENTIMETDEVRMKRFGKMNQELKEETDLNVIEIDEF